MRTIEEQRFREVAAAKCVARLVVPGEFSERVNLSSRERLACGSVTPNAVISARVSARAWWRATASVQHRLTAR